jgi:hypothetical protein
MSKIKANDAIVLILFLSITFFIAFAWFLQRSCRRAIDAEVHEMQHKSDLEARKITGWNEQVHGNGNGNGNGNVGSS